MRIKTWEDGMVVILLCRTWSLICIGILRLLGLVLYLPTMCGGFGEYVGCY